MSNPYRSTNDTTYGVTSYGYDALGHKILQTNQDGTKQRWSWSGNQSDFYNELGKHWQRTYDAFDDLLTVMEPNGNNNLAYETDYQYDSQSNLTRVDQWGGAKGNAGDRVRSFLYDGLSRLTSSTNPEAGIIGYTYDANSNVQTKTDARGVVITYNYDLLNRMTGKTYTNDPSNTPAVKTYYDTPITNWTFAPETYPATTPATVKSIAQSNLVGRASYATNGGATMVYGYDEAGRMVLKSECTPSTCAKNDHYDMHAVYDLAGNTTFADLGVDSARNAATPNAGYYYGGLLMSYANAGKTAGQLVTGTADIVDATHPASIVSGLQYSPLGGMTSESFGSVYGEGNTFSPRGWLNTRYGLLSNGFERSGTLTHDPAGNVTQLADSLTGATTYATDQLNRLTSSSNASAGATYRYDAWGNLNGRTITAGAGYSYAFTITPQNRVSQSGSTDPYFLYDASGDVLSDGLNTYSYDGEGRLFAVSGSTHYLYGPDGTRTATVQGGAVTAEYLYNIGGNLATTVDAAGKLVRGALYGGGMHLADYTAGTGAGGGKTEFHLSDAVNSLINMIDQTGAALESCAAGAFGEALNCSSAVDYTENHFADTKRDQESNLDAMGARYYSSIVGRFMTPDWANKPEAVPYSDLMNPQSLNLYSYVNNNPLSKIDKDGHDPNDITNFLAGVANAFGSDNLLGAGRVNQGTTAGQLGASVGDLGAAVQGAAQVVLGTGGNIVGGALDATGVGAAVGVPVNVVFTAITVEGAGAAATGAMNLMKDSSPKSNPMTGQPGSTSQTAQSDGSPKQVRRYGSDGYPQTDVDHGHDHGQGDPHAHDWDRPANGGPPTHIDRGWGRSVNPDDPKPQ